MESLYSLEQKLNNAKKELQKITIKKYGDVPWAPGVLDQHKSESYSYDEYTDTRKAYALKEEIRKLQYLIDTYQERVQEERLRKQELIDSKIPKYEYISNKQKETTTNPAIAARYNAQQRLFGMSKLQKTIASITGQRKKFRKLWRKTITANQKNQEEIARELNKLFR